MSRRIGMSGSPIGDLFGDSPPPSSISTSFRLSPQIRRAVQMDMAEQGYSLRGRVRWIDEAVDAFLDEDFWARLGTPNGWKRVVLDLELHPDADAQKEYIYLSESLRNRLMRAAALAFLHGTEQEEPLYLEISIASVLRAAILWRLEQRRARST